MLDTSYIEQTTGFSEQTVKGVIDGFIKFIQLELRSGNEVKISDFGVFYPKEYGERKSRNPSTGEAIMAKPRTKPRLRFYGNFEKMIQDNPDTPDELPPAPPSQVHISDLIPPPPPPAPSKIWYIADSGKSIPMAESEMKGKIGANTQVWSQETDWKLAGELPELKYLLA